MQLLKFKSELSPPVVPSTELSQLVKISLHHPETYTHHFVQNRWDTLAHGGLSNMILSSVALMHLCQWLQLFLVRVVGVCCVCCGRVVSVCFKRVLGACILWACVVSVCCGCVL